VAGIDEALIIVRRIHVQLSEPHDLSGFPLTVGVSVGASVAPIHGSSGAALMASADLAMYRAKQFGTGIEFATEGDARHDVGRVGLLSDLTAAIGTNQLSVHYQPLVRLADGSVESVEALLRWQHPEYGNIPPSEFIGMAEQTDLIGPLTDFVVRAAMADLLSLGPEMPRLAVNVAARTLLDRQFATNLLATIDSLGFPPDLFEIEVTERDIATGSDRSTLTLAHLRSLGVQISIDDFGTGYSSFLTLRELNADRLKIDAQFTSRLVGSRADDVIVAKVIEIAHHLGIDVVAEGVESEAVRWRLGELGCDLVQGYAIARPMPFDRLVHWLRATRQPVPIAALTATDPVLLTAVAS
jgi:EAL domain-containing protein (putative c-di-GMP-specific phosphodiesterase class I)